MPILFKIPFKEKKLRIVLVGLFLILGLSIASIFLVLGRSAAETHEKNAWVDHTYQVIDQLNEARILFRECQTSITSFIITCRQERENDYYAKKQAFINKLNQIEYMVQDNAIQTSRINIIREDLKPRFSRFETVLWNFKNDKETYWKMVLSGDGQPLTAKIIDGLTSMKVKEDELLSQRTFDYDNSKIWYDRALLYLYIFVLLLFAVTFTVTWILLKIREQEKFLATLNKALEEKVNEKTKALTDTNRELEAFSYTVSHDLRAPLRAIQGFANILKEDYTKVLDSNGKRLFTIIINNIAKMDDLITDLLDFAKIGRKDMLRSPVNVRNIFLEAVAESKLLYPNKLYQVTVGEMPIEKADASMLRQAIVNLVSNAFKFSSKRDQPQIIIEYKKGVYSIKDNGQGFSMKFYSRLFEIFQRLHLEKDFTGTGVGLSISKKVIEKHGGRIWAESEVDKGAAFYFTLDKSV